ncbi:MAG: hypothetical protein KAJ46_06650, partial [Sedimentisphaerales bacterium]|nr:hypothetical protein [Sedimentisphaerales bacterium]
MAEDEKNKLILGMDEQVDDNNSLPRARKDVEFTEQVFFGKPCFVLKDPASLRYYRLRPPEYAIYQMLDGNTAMEDVLK